jgi:hypothetical protein
MPRRFAGVDLVLRRSAGLVETLFNQHLLILVKLFFQPRSFRQDFAASSESYPEGSQEDDLIHLHVDGIFHNIFEFPDNFRASCNLLSACKASGLKSLMFLV